MFSDKFFVDSDNDVLILHLKDGFGSFYIAIIASANLSQIWYLSLWVDRRFFNFLVM